MVNKYIEEICVSCSHEVNLISAKLVLTSIPAVIKANIV